MTAIFGWHFINELTENKSQEGSIKKKKKDKKQTR